jgi:hypothetical protein
LLLKGAMEHAEQAGLSPAVPAVPHAPEKPVWPLEQLVGIKGDVIAVKPEGIVIQPFVSTYNPSNYQGRLPADASVGDQKRLVAMATREEEGVGYPEPKVMDRGHLVYTGVKAQRTAQSRLLLQGYPFQVRIGEKMNLLAAPMRDGYSYTLNYVLANGRGVPSSNPLSRQAWSLPPLASPTPALVLVGSQAAPRRQLTAAEQNAEIARKYGAR